MEDDRIKSVIQIQYMKGELSYLDAIEELANKCGMDLLTAEVTVSDWEKDIEEVDYKN